MKWTKKLLILVMMIIHPMDIYHGCCDEEMKANNELKISKTR
jgi:hypothetical protein